MPKGPTIWLAFSILLLAAWIIWHFIRFRRWSSFLFSSTGVVAYAFLLRALFGFPAFSTGEAKGDQGNVWIVYASAYLCMVIGILAESLYQYLDSCPAETRKFDIGDVLKPLLVSPMIFMPLAASMQSANVDLAATDGPRLMLLLVAFENGFLWKGYFTRKMRESRQGAPRARRTAR